MSTGCRECQADWEHCHGAVIHHPGRRSECTQDGCESPEGSPHAFSIDCDAVGCPCAAAVALAV
jgi:hypothetical protein